MRKIIITLLLLLVLSSYVSAFSFPFFHFGSKAKGVDAIQEQQVFKRLVLNKPRHAEFEIHNPLDTPISDIKLSFNNKCGGVRHYRLLVNSTCTKRVVDHYDTKTEQNCVQLANGTECNTQTVILKTYYKNVTYPCWVPLKSIKGLSNHKVKIEVRSGDMIWGKCPDGTFGYKVDWIPEIQLKDKSGKRKIFKMWEWAWWNSTFTKAKNITINNTAENLTDYQLRINITYDADMQADFSDIRFTWYNATSGLEQEIPYWVEMKEDSSWAVVYIKVPELPVGTNINTVKMYYGNPTATSNSNINEVWGEGLLGLWLFDEVNGNTTPDYVNGNNATLYNGATLVSSYEGNGLSLDGVDDVAVTPQSLDYFTSNITVIAVIKPANIGNGLPKGIVESGIYGSTAGGNPNYRLQINAIDQLRWTGEVSATWVVADGTPTLANNQWYQTVLAYDGSYTDLFLNGTNILHYAKAGALQTINFSLIFGAYRDPTYFLQGIIDSVRIYDHELPSSAYQFPNPLPTYSFSAEWTESTADTTPPATVTNLQNVSQGTTWIYWNWTNPADADFDHCEVYKNYSFYANTSNNYINMTGLNSGTTYEIEIRTVDTSGNVNTTWVTATANTVWVNTTPSNNSCSCPAVGSDWHINMSQNCVLSDCDIGLNDMYLEGSGTITINGTVKVNHIYNPSNSHIIVIYGNLITSDPVIFLGTNVRIIGGKLHVGD